MPALNPIQTSFAQGVISPRMRGNVGSKPYQRGLAKCENWIPTPQGSLLKRNGVDVVAQAANSLNPFVRILPFKSTSLERFQIALLDSEVQVYTAAGVFAAFVQERIANGECNSYGGGWTLSGLGARYAVSASDHRIELGASTSAPVFSGSAKQAPAAVPAGDYRLTVNVRRLSTHARLVVRVGTADGLGDLLDTTVTAAGAASFLITQPGLGAVHVFFGAQNTVASGATSLEIDDVSLRAVTGGTSTPAPWLATEAAQVQYVAETGRDRMVLVHPKYEPQVLTRAADGTWSLNAISTIGWVIPKAPPAFAVNAWSAGEWPSVVDVWQGRLWMAATPTRKNTFWASKPGTYDFTIGSTAGDGFSYDVAMKGEIRWLQGQKAMLAGTDEGEYSISANDGVVYAGNINIRQESAFGSAAIQACPIGDEVVYVSPDRRKVRAMRFSLEGGGWYSRDLTFAAEHITKPGIIDLVFARHPFDTIAALLGDGTLACCNYNRADEVNGWWNVAPVGGAYTSVSVNTAPDGDEVWGVASLLAAADAFTPWHLVRLRLYELLDPQLDMSIGPVAARAMADYLGPTYGTAAYDAGTGLVTLSGPLFHAAAHATGYVIRIGATLYRVVDNSGLLNDTEALVEVVEGPTDSQAATADWGWHSWVIPTLIANRNWAFPFPLGTMVRAVDVGTNEYFDTAITNSLFLVAPREEADIFVVGLPFTAEAETLPLEGGNPAGTAQGFKVHYPDLSVRISDSVAPLVNGKRAGAGRPFSVPLDETEPRFTDDLTVKNVGVSVGGAITISQDLPFRTEVCAVYGQAQINKV